MPIINLKRGRYLREVLTNIIAVSLTRIYLLVISSLKLEFVKERLRIKKIVISFID
jgi:hypothetical protein